MMMFRLSLFKVGIGLTSSQDSIDILSPESIGNTPPIKYKTNIAPERKIAFQLSSFRGKIYKHWAPPVIIGDVKSIRPEVVYKEHLNCRPSFSGIGKLNVISP